MKVIALVLLSLIAGCALADQPYADIENGRVEGFWQTIDGKQLATYYGIPYALPPVGELRWMPPVKYTEQWDSPYQATELTSVCPQNPANVGPYNQTISEDCLYLNVWAPLPDYPGETFPVLYWIHGGAFVEGGVMYYGNGNFTNLAVRQRIIVVGVEYRVNAIGFFSSDLLIPTDPNDDRGTYGLLDQRLGLFWTKNNIAAFGGRPDEVTIHGQSAGAISAHLHMVSPVNQVGRPCRPVVQPTGCPDKVFLRASAASGYADVLPPQNNPADANLLTQLNCTTLQCAKSKTWQEVIAAAGGTLLSFQPTKGSRFLPDDPITLLAQWATNGSKQCPMPLQAPEFGVFDEGCTDSDDTLAHERASGCSMSSPVEFIDGVASQEGSTILAAIWAQSTQTPLIPDMATASIVMALLTDPTNLTYWYTNFAQFYTYPDGPNQPNPQTGFIQQVNDAEVCNNWNDLIYYSYITPKIFAYYFDIAPASVKYNFYNTSLGGAFHTSEEFLIQDWCDGYYCAYLTPTQHNIAVKMQGLWASFIKGGKPLNPNLPAWISFNKNTQSLYRFNEASALMGMVPFTSLNDHKYYLYKPRCDQINQIREQHYGVPALNPSTYLLSYL